MMLWLWQHMQSKPWQQKGPNETWLTLRWTSFRHLSSRACCFVNSGDSPAANHLLNSRTHVALSQGRPNWMGSCCLVLQCRNFRLAEETISHRNTEQLRLEGTSWNCLKIPFSLHTCSQFNMLEAPYMCCHRQWDLSHSSQQDPSLQSLGTVGRSFGSGC